jgi:putative glutamine amidotransferase
MTAKPVIGLSSYREQARFRVWDTPTDLLPARYAQSVEAAGGIPVLLPTLSRGATEVVSRLDGLIVSGGNDIEPRRYGAEPDQRTVGWRPERDAWELALLDAADQAGLPTLGICRGMQLMAVWAGGVLDQHLPDIVGDSRHAPGPDVYGSMNIETVEGSRVERLLGHRFQVRCHHHQAVAKHPGYDESARAADGVIEAIESPERPFWLAVQWHPEVLDDFGLFRGLVEAAAR